MSEKRRTTAEIRRSLARHRRELEEDLDELEDRAEERLNLRNLVARHPVIVGALGALVGVLVVRRPALAAKSLTRLAQVGAPLLLKAFLKRDGGESPREPTPAPERDP